MIFVQFKCIRSLDIFRGISHSHSHSHSLSKWNEHLLTDAYLCWHNICDRRQQLRKFKENIPTMK